MKMLASAAFEPSKLYHWGGSPAPSSIRTMDCRQKGMLKIYERSQNVYENKQNIDKVPDGKSDIYVEVMRFLQKGEAFFVTIFPL